MTEPTVLFLWPGVEINPHVGSGKIGPTEGGVIATAAKAGSAIATVRADHTQRRRQTADGLRDAVRMLQPWTAAVGVGRIARVTNFLRPIGLPALVPLREFVVSPGFAGVAAVVAAGLALCAVLYGSRRATKRFERELVQRERHHERAREDERSAAAVTRCWERLVWVVENASIEPAASGGASLGLGPKLVVELVRGLLRDAEQLDDLTLAQAVAVYQDQFGLVLAQQGASLSGLAAGASPLASGKPDEMPASSVDEKPDIAAAPAAVETPPAAVETPPATVRVADGNG